jgi:hypothetical protein
VKRSPLVRRTPMPRSGVSLRARSPKTARAYVQRRALVAALLAERPVCERCGVARSTDVHELKRRSQGGALLGEDGKACLCRACHDWCGQNPLAAHEQGWVVWSYEDDRRQAS